MTSKKIIILGPAYPYRGGQALVEAYLHNAITQMGFETITVSYSLLYPSIFFPGTTQFDKSSFIPFKHESKIFRLLNSINPISWFSTFSFIKRQKPNAVIFVWWMPFFGPALGCIARLIKLKLKETKIIFLVENYVSHENRWFDSFFTKQTLKFADSFISQSSYITQQILHDFPNKKVYQTTLSVFDCYNLNRYTKETAKKELKIDSKHVILFFGMIRPYKGLDKLIESFASLKHLDASLLIVGESYENFDKYEQLLQTFQLKDRTKIFNKFIENENVEIFFKAADVVVLPYYSGTQSGILMLAYGFGVPVVVTNVGGVAELVISGKTGTVVPDNNVSNLAPAIDQILQSIHEVNYGDEIKAHTKNLGYATLKNMFEESFSK